MNSYFGALHNYYCESVRPNVLNACAVGELVDSQWGIFVMYPTLRNDALVKASENGHTQLMEVLVEAGADDAERALHGACTYREDEAACLLIEMGAPCTGLCERDLRWLMDCGVEWDWFPKDLAKRAQQERTEVIRAVQRVLISDVTSVIGQYIAFD